MMRIKRDSEYCLERLPNGRRTACRSGAALERTLEYSERLLDLREILS